MPRNHFAYQIQSQMQPKGDQPKAIAALTRGLKASKSHQTLLGVTGSGKTFTVANIIAALNLPTLVVAHNKTLAAQLYEEFKGLFPNNAVEYFVSYYDYYQPEAYVPQSDTYIDKEATINDAIDRMRHAATRSLFERDDVILVASVSCIYGIGSAEAYQGTLIWLEQDHDYMQKELFERLVAIQYQRNELDFHRGTFRVRGDVVDIFPAHEAQEAIRLTFFGDTLERIAMTDPLTGKILRTLSKIAIYPATHHVVTESSQIQAIASITQELQERLTWLRQNNYLLEAQRLEQRTQFDLEMLAEMGRCNGIENYSRHLTQRPPGAPPPTLLDYFPKDFLCVIDESHQTLPQLQAMYKGDRSRKETLVAHGFRLPSALDNRPLQFPEFQQHLDRVLYVSATPGDYELSATQGVVVEQIIRPTGLIDPPITLRPVAQQIDDLLQEIHQCTQQGYRTLITTLTKRMAEDICDYYTEAGLKIRYLHADIDTLERIEILHQLRQGQFDALVGINLLREGLDLPEVALVAVLDADKEGFLRSRRSLIQIMGRAARNVHGRVILYADKITPSMQEAMDEVERRRQLQMAYNHAHNITPISTQRTMHLWRLDPQGQDPQAPGKAGAKGTKSAQEARPLPADVEGAIASLRAEMQGAAKLLDFERAAKLRDELLILEGQVLKLGLGRGA